jgi:hypothetical protein
MDCLWTLHHKGERKTLDFVVSIYRLWVLTEAYGGARLISKYLQSATTALICAID